MFKNIKQGLGIGLGVVAGISLFGVGAVCLKDLPVRLEYAAYKFKLNGLEIKRNCPSPSVQCRSFDTRVKQSIQGFFLSREDIQWELP